VSRKSAAYFFIVKYNRCSAKPHQARNSEPRSANPIPGAELSPSCRLLESLVHSIQSRKASGRRAHTQWSAFFSLRTIAISPRA
jgi:hypothetical protein